MTILIDGKAIAAKVIDDVKKSAARFERESGQRVCLAVVIVGDDPASHTYVGAKGRMARECGFDAIQRTLPVDTTQAELLDVVRHLNDELRVHGILVQLPLPSHLDSDAVIQSIRPEKDVDGLHVVNAGKLATGDLKTGVVSCTPAGAMMLVESVRGADLSGLNAVVIGRSNLFGKPMAQLLLNANATVTVAHSRTKKLDEVARTADVLVVAVGRRELVKAEWVKLGATVIDVGINRIIDPAASHGSRLVGDVDFNACFERAGAITPVPGGVGPMTIAMLMQNSVNCAEGLNHTG